MKYLQFFILFLSVSACYAQKTGCVSGDCVNGFGKYVFSDNASELDYYEGNFIKYHQTGQGTEIKTTVNVAGTGKEFYPLFILTGVWNDGILKQGAVINFSGKKSADTVLMRAGLFNDKGVLENGEKKTFYEDNSGSKKTITCKGLFEQGEFTKGEITINNYSNYPSQTFSVDGPNVVKGTDPNVAVKGTVITITGYAVEFNGDYDLATLPPDGCVSGDCEKGQGKRVLASIDYLGPHIRIMTGKFLYKTFVGSGTMMVGGESVLTNGIYAISKLKPNYKTNQVEAKASFKPANSNEIVEGVFKGYNDFGLGKATASYQTYVECKFQPEGKDQTEWTRFIYNPWDNIWLTNWLNSDEYKQGQQRAMAYRIKNFGPQNSAPKDRCSCCAGSGKIIRKSFNHALSVNINYMLYEEIRCNCCNGSGKGSQQTSYKPATDGGVNLDYHNYNH